MTDPDNIPTRELRRWSAAIPRDSAEMLAAQLDFALRAANEMLVSGATAWNALFRTYVDGFDAVRCALSGLLIDWHQRLLDSRTR